MLIFRTRALWVFVFACAWILAQGKLAGAEVSGAIRYAGPLEGNIIVQAWRPKPGNRVLRLDGKSGYVVTSLKDLSGPELTIEFWFRGSSIQSAVRQQNGGLEDFDEKPNGRDRPKTGASPSGWIVIGWNGFHVLSHDGLLNGVYYAQEVTDGQWHHVAMTWKQDDRNGFASYFDGRQVYRRKSANEPIPDYNSPVYFGSFAGGSEFASGQFDEIGIWKRALSEAEISNSWHQPLRGDEPGLRGCWNFDDATAEDSSPNHFHGQLKGGATIEDADVPGLESPVLTTRAAKNGRYTLTNLVVGAEYEMVAFLDVNGNGVLDAWEPRSDAALGVLRAQAAPVALNLRLGVHVPFFRSGLFRALLTFALLTAAGGFMWLRQHRQMRRRVEEFQRQHQLEHERGRIAQDIHDELGAKLSRISYLCEAAKCGDKQGRRPELEVVGLAARDLLRALDTIVWAVSPRNDTLEDLVEYAGQYASEFFSMTGVECQVILPRDLPEWPLTSQPRHELLRVIQESLSNALKHANATHVVLKFDAQDGRLLITISDNGRGFDADQSGTSRLGGGNGLRIIRERVSGLGGNFRMESAPGRGTTLFYSFPLMAKAGRQGLFSSEGATMPEEVQTTGALAS
jgi:signal transduction histidine kinase